MLRVRKINKLFLKYCRIRFPDQLFWFPEGKNTTNEYWSPNLYNHMRFEITPD